MARNGADAKSHTLVKGYFLILVAYYSLLLQSGYIALWYMTHALYIASDVHKQILFLKAFARFIIVYISRRNGACEIKPTGSACIRQ